MFVVAMITSIGIVLVLYHHIVYPAALAALARRRPRAMPPAPRRGWRACDAADTLLPTVTFVVPAYDESAVIAEKIRNIAASDYPADRLQVLIVADGCTDDAAAVARAPGNGSNAAISGWRSSSSQRPRQSSRYLNHVLPKIESDLIALGDASALTSIDALLLAAEHFADPHVGVVCARVSLLRPGLPGEEVYWAHQVRLKEREAAIGAPRVRTVPSTYSGAGCSSRCRRTR